MPNGHGEREAYLEIAIKTVKESRKKRRADHGTSTTPPNEWAADVLLTELETIRRRLEEVGVGND